MAHNVFADQYHSPLAQSRQQVNYTLGSISKLRHVLGEEHNSTPTSYMRYTPQANFIKKASTQNLSLFTSHYPTTFKAKCDEVAKEWTTLPLQELINIYPQLLNDIFGFSGGKGWGLKLYEPKNYACEFKAGFDFLSCDGALFKIIEKLMTQQEAVFQFPYARLPAGIIKCIEKEGELPRLYEKKVTLLPNNHSVINFNALEYYLAMFACYMLYPETNQETNNWSGINDILYIKLFDDYMKNFFPLIENNIHSAYASTIIQSATKTNLLKSHHGHLSSPYFMQLHLSSFAEVFLQIFCDFWLTLDTEAFSQLENSDHYLPSLNHAQTVRMLVKHLHSFISTCEEKEYIQRLNSENNLQLQVQELKCVVIPAILNRKLYMYLQHCFQHWQLDASFRMVLETWLSFIQPWRYSEAFNTSLEEDSREVNLSSWQRFIKENFTFYSSIFQMFLTRALRSDLKSIGDVYLIYRVAKVFAQSTLPNILQQIDQSLDCLSSPGQYTSAAGLMSEWKRMQLKQQTLNDHNFFSSVVTKKVERLCELLAAAGIDIRRKLLLSKHSHETDRADTFFDRMKDWFWLTNEFDNDHEQAEQQLLSFLQLSCTLLSSIFQLPVSQEISPDYPDAVNNSNFGGDDVTSGMPECVVSSDGLKLTDKGRMQILQGLREFKVVYSGDPELQPLRSYESEFAVRLLYDVAKKLNGKYAVMLEVLYNRDDIVGCLLRKASKGIPHLHYVDTPVPRQRIAIKPRLSLRFAGSYYFMCYLCWFMILSKLIISFNWISVFLLALLFFVLSVFFNIDVPPENIKKL